MPENVAVACFATFWTWEGFDAGYTVAQNRSKRKVSKTSRTMSMVIEGLQNRRVRGGQAESQCKIKRSRGAYLMVRL